MPVSLTSVVGPACPSTRLLADRFDVTGVDISEAQLDAARRNVPGASFVHDDLMRTSTSHSESIRRRGGVLLHLSRAPRGASPVCSSGSLGGSSQADSFWRRSERGDDPGWIGEWLGQPMFFSSHDADGNRRLLTAANFDLLIDDVVDTPEPEGPVPFLWVLAQRRA